MSFLIGVMTRRFYFAQDMGMGKSLLCIAICRYFNRIEKVKRTLILVPNRTNKYDWLEEFKLWTKAECLLLEGSFNQKWKALRDSNSEFVVETYGGFTRMASVKVRKPGKKRDQLDVDLKLMRELQSIFQAIVFDEITNAKSKASLMFRIGRFLSKNAYCVFGLSGTPFGRDVQDLWAQLYLIDLGATLGQTLTLFRAAFFTQKATGFGGYRYKFRKAMDARLHRMLANRMVRYVAAECDLPKVVPIIKSVALPEIAEDYYQRMRDKLYASKGNVKEMQNAFLRMRQISSGFMGYKDDETGERASFEFPDKPKLQALLDLIESTDQKLVVFHDFIFSGDCISRELGKMKIKFARLYGKTKDPAEQMRKFNEDEDVQVMLLNNSAGGFGLNRLRVAKYAVYYESPVSSIIRKQTLRRVQRQGSKHKSVFVYDLVVKGTVDSMILDWHEQSEGLFAAIVEGKVKL